LKLNRLDEAIADYNSALQLSPRLASSLFGRGVAKLKKGDTDGGNADIAAAKAIQADVADEFAGYGIALAGEPASGNPSVPNPEQQAPAPQQPPTRGIPSEKP
jgi:hypothetical protein